LNQKGLGVIEFQEQFLEPCKSLHLVNYHIDYLLRNKEDLQQYKSVVREF